MNIEVGSFAIIRIPSMKEFDLMTGVVTEVLYDGSVNLARLDRQDIPLAYGQKLDPELNEIHTPPSRDNWDDLPF